MNDVRLEIDSAVIDLACVRFIYESSELPGSGEYLLSLVKERVDEEMLSFANLIAVEQPIEKQMRHWMFWLAPIVMRFVAPNDCMSDCWVINDVQSIMESESTYTIRGRCSPWMGKP